MFEIAVDLQETSTIYKRTVYTVWDCLGDIGGLHGTLFVLGGHFISLFSILTGTASHLMLKVVEKVYKFEAPKSKRNSRDISDWLSNRRAAKYTTFGCLKRKDKMVRDAATRIDKELDIAEFIKHQFID